MDSLKLSLDFVLKLRSWDVCDGGLSEPEKSAELRTLESTDPRFHLWDHDQVSASSSHHCFVHKTEVTPAKENQMSWLMLGLLWTLAKCSKYK